MKHYINEVAKDFDICEFFEKILVVIYVVSMIISLILCFKFNNLMCILLIICHIFYVIFDTFNDMILKNYAENERRKTLLANSFDANITEKKTNGYYNNEEKKSLKKMGINSFESVLFSRNNSKIMIKNNALKFIFEILIWLIIILIVKDKNIILCVTQCIFSTELLVNYLKLVYFYLKVNKIYGEFYKIFITEGYSKKLETITLQYVFEYECLKNYSHILLSQRNFENNNVSWSNEWDNLLKNIR